MLPTYTNPQTQIHTCTSKTHKPNSIWIRNDTLHSSSDPKTDFDIGHFLPPIYLPLSLWSATFSTAVCSGNTMCFKFQQVVRFLSSTTIFRYRYIYRQCSNFLVSFSDKLSVKCDWLIQEIKIYFVLCNTVMRDCTKEEGKCRTVVILH